MLMTLWRFSRICPFFQIHTKSWWGLFWGGGGDPSFNQVLLKSIPQFLCNPADETTSQQTNKQTRLKKGFGGGVCCNYRHKTKLCGNVAQGEPTKLFSNLSNFKSGSLEDSINNIIVCSIYKIQILRTDQFQNSFFIRPCDAKQLRCSYSVSSISGARVC